MGRDGGVVQRGRGGGREKGGDVFTDKWGETAVLFRGGEEGGGRREEMCLQTSGERWRVLFRGGGWGRGKGGDVFTDKWGKMAGVVQRGRVGEGEGRRCVCKLLTGSLASEDVGVLLTGCVCVCVGGGGAALREGKLEGERKRGGGGGVTGW